MCRVIQTLAAMLPLYGVREGGPSRPRGGRKRIILLITVASALLWLAYAASAQVTTGSVQGTITDPSSAAVPGVQTELVSEGTKITLTQTTGPEGQFIFNLVPPGNYTLRATAQGFRTAVISGIPVEVNKTVRADVVLQVGAVAETIEVSGVASQIDTVSAQVSLNVTPQYVLNLPSSSRNSLAFAEMAPGVTVSNTLSQVMNIEGTYASVNNNRSYRNIFYLDGSDNTGSFRNSGLQFPNPEAVAEVSVSTTNTSAEFGKQPGGTFNVITKSGTNQLHGSGFYYFRNEALDANSWSRNKSGTARAPQFLKQGGGTVGGPILKDRTFFFASFMVYRDNAPGFQNTRQFPTAAMAQGDFSQFGKQLYDPGTGQPLSNNQIPQSLLDPVALNVLKLIPTVPNYGDRYVWSYNDPTANQEFLAKIDHRFNAASSLQFSWFRTWGHQDLNATAANGNVPQWGPQVNKSHQNTLSVRETWIASNNIVVESRFALAYLYCDRGNANIGKNLSDFGAVWPINTEGDRKYLPQLSISDGFSAQQGYLSVLPQNNFRFGSSLSWVKNRHNVKFGGEAQKESIRQRNDTDAASFTFDGRSSSKVNGTSKGIGVFGYSMADFVMGRVASFSARGLLDYDISNWAYFFFLQDEWKVSRRLTLTPGLRYEIYAPATEKTGRADAFILNHRSNLYPNAPPNLAFQGDAGIPGGFFQTDRNNFAPRLGVAYDVAGDGKTVIRGGVGFYYSYSNFNSKMWTTEAPPWVPSASGGEARLYDPWGTSTTIVYPTVPMPFSRDVSNYPYPSRLTNIIGFDSNFRTPYSLQWNATLARQLTKVFTINASYVANRAFKLLQQNPFNLPVWTDNASLSNIETRRPISQYSRVGTIYSRARSWFDSFQLATDARLTRGLTARFTYVLASAYDIISADPTSNSDMQTANPMNWDGEKGQVGARHTARVFYVYALPLLRNHSGWLGKMLGGWQISGNVYASTGTPLNVTLGQDWNYDGISGDRPDQVGPIQYASGSKDERMAAYFVRSSFAAPQTHNTFGSLSRNALRGPGQWNSDAALSKNFRFTERKVFEVRAEAFDVLNHNNLSSPNTTMTSADFTKILSRSGNRTMQIGLRFAF